MKFQACRYKVESSDDWIPGIASLNDWGVPDVEFIVNAETGKLAPIVIWNYVLEEGPNKYLEVLLLKSNKVCK